MKDAPPSPAGAAGDPWLPAPWLPLDAVRERDMGAFVTGSILAAGGARVPDRPPCATWLLLSWLCERYPVVLHGSNDPNIRTFEPRRPRDRSADEFSKQKAVFATSDGIWATFYAVLDRTTPALTFMNAALQFAAPGTSAGWSEMRYFFSIAKAARRAGPWREGTVYVLPSEGFGQQRPYRLGGRLVREPHFACPRPVRPLARVSVTPEDFPLLDHVRSHDPAVIEARATADPGGFPWIP